jgi:O-glycosyl hydrolase
MVRIYVDFNKKLRVWDGFGLQYLENFDTPDIIKKRQDYGGFSLLSPDDKNNVSQLLFGSDGPKPAILRIFLDPFHQNTVQDSKITEDTLVDRNGYDHETSTTWTRGFLSSAYSSMREWGGSLKVIVNCPAPPFWMTKQNEISGRDLDPANRINYARYMVSWIKYLKEKEQIPVFALSIHNQGENLNFWDDGGHFIHRTQNMYNLFWPSEQVNDFLGLLRRILDKNSFEDVIVTPGDTTNFVHFHEWGYADAIADNPKALESLGLITSNGFPSQVIGKYCGDWRSVGIDVLRELKPDLHAWVTSMGTIRNDPEFIWELHNQIYGSKVNAVISGNSTHNMNKGTNSISMISIKNDGSFEINPSYYSFKAISIAGQPGMSVCQVSSNSSEIFLIGFANNNSRNHDSFVVVNLSEKELELPIEIRGSACSSFYVYRTSQNEKFIRIGAVPIREGKIHYKSPPQSVTSFLGTL